MRIYKDIAHKLETVVVGDDGKPVTGLSINYGVYKCSDNSLVISGTMSEIALVYTTEITLTTVGEYRVKYTTPAGYDDDFEILIVDDYDNFKADVSLFALDSTVAKEAQATINKNDIIVEIDANETKIDNVKSDTESIKTTVEGLDLELDDVAKESTLSNKASQASVDAIAAETDKIKYILGLNQENFRIFNLTYSNNNLLTSTVKIYTSASDCNSDINAIASYSVVATYDSNGDMQTYKVTKD